MNNTAISLEWDAPYFIGNKAMKNYCFPWCEQKHSTESNIKFQSRKEAEQTGYHPCKYCCPILPYRAWKDENKSITVIAPKEFSFKQNLHYLSRSKNECMFHIENNKIYRVVPIEGKNPLIETSVNNEGNIHVRFLGDEMPPEKWVRAAVARYVREWFDLDTDLTPFYDVAKNDVLLSKPINEYYGLRNMGIPDLFEALCWGIIGQQINLTFAYTLKRRFVESFGEHIEWNGQKYWIFPAPEVIANLSVEDLTELKMTIRKCEYLIGVAKLITQGVLSKGLFINSDLKNAEKILTDIRGIGPWTANYVLMRCLRFPSAFPIDDVGLHNVIKLLTKSDQKPTKKEIREYASAWRNWESYATFYLWRVLY
ncbi:DNA-3-methyladenine glycosylase [Bacillus cereus]|uniref:Ada metal-binding domain-containing protein n=1 Tax=Bacillus cereus TaxID=1396 RepID=UPI000BF4295C|nr:Ada metal-binding domain-containing protein [Bacillus cereus]PFR23013.1 DNA-3-methyladenine glycosylase [Bacillus cereus]PGZ20469.1 DNA-3-methyladenine glycosylase [Bacillus cereus]